MWNCVLCSLLAKPVLESIHYTLIILDHKLNEQNYFLEIDKVFSITNSQVKEQCYLFVLRTSDLVFYCDCPNIFYFSKTINSWQQQAWQGWSDISVTTQHYWLD